MASSTGTLASFPGLLYTPPVLIVYRVHAYRMYEAIKKFKKSGGAEGWERGYGYISCFKSSLLSHRTKMCT